MKNTIIALLFAVAMSSTAYAQKISADKVPASVTSAFKTKFPNATQIKWEMEGGDYEAGFKLNGEEMSANFDNTGKWLETETEIKTAALPASIQSALKKDFEGYKLKEASKVESLKNGNSFEVEIQKGEEAFDVLFSTEGKVLSKIKHEKKEKKD